jgi:hypothetical protein
MDTVSEENHMFNRFRVPAVIVCLLLPATVQAQIVISGTGANAAGITGVRDSFRTLIGGGTVAGANGSFGGVRREINWDAVPDAFSSPNNLPANFFNANSPRGTVFSGPGSGFQVSANAGVAQIQFDNINPTYSSTFEQFSPQKLFTAIGSNIVDVNFFIPGTNLATTTSAFGSIFSDVDLANTTSIQFFDRNNASLGTFFVPNLAGSETFSFLGVQYGAPVISRVRITNGNAALAAGVNENAQVDLVVMDDFIFAEPVPEPGAVALFAGVAVTGGLAIIRRRRMRGKTVSKA